MKSFPVAEPKFAGLAAKEDLFAAEAEQLRPAFRPRLLRTLFL